MPVDVYLQVRLVIRADTGINGYDLQPEEQSLTPMFIYESETDAGINPLTFIPDDTSYDTVRGLHRLPCQHDREGDGRRMTRAPGDVAGSGCLQEQVDFVALFLSGGLS